MISKEYIIKFQLIKQLLREVEIHSRLNHKHIVKMLAYFHDLNNAYIVMEYVPNKSLFYYLIKN